LRFADSGRHLWLVSPTLASRSDLPLPIFASADAAIGAAADLLPPCARRALLVEDSASLAFLPE